MALAASPCSHSMRPPLREAGSRSCPRARDTTQGLVSLLDTSPWVHSVFTTTTLLGSVGVAARRRGTPECSAPRASPPADGALLSSTSAASLPPLQGCGVHGGSWRFPHCCEVLQGKHLRICRRWSQPGRSSMEAGGHSELAHGSPDPPIWRLLCPPSPHGPLSAYRKPRPGTESGRDGVLRRCAGRPLGPLQAQGLKGSSDSELGRDFLFPALVAQSPRHRSPGDRQPWAVSRLMCPCPQACIQRQTQVPRTPGPVARKPQAGLSADLQSLRRWWPQSRGSPRRLVWGGGYCLPGPPRQCPWAYTGDQIRMETRSSLESSTFFFFYF